MRPLPLVAIALTIAIAAMPTIARADFKVHPPDAETGEIEIEHVGSFGTSGQPGTSDEQSFVGELGYGVNNWWHTELEFESGRDAGPGNHLKFDQITSENVFQFTERGQYWADVGFFWEYGHAMLRGQPDETTFGPIFRKEIGPTIDTVNLFLEKDIGRFSSGRPSFSYAVESRLALGTVIEPGIQAYGEPGPFGHFAAMGDQDHRIGPQLFTNISALGPGSLQMNGGVLFGLTHASPRITWRWQFEYELHL